MCTFFFRVLYPINPVSWHFTSSYLAWVDRCCSKEFLSVVSLLLLSAICGEPISIEQHCHRDPVYDWWCHICHLHTIMGLVIGQGHAAVLCALFRQPFHIVWISPPWTRAFFGLSSCEWIFARLCLGPSWVSLETKSNLKHIKIGEVSIGVQTGNILRSLWRTFEAVNMNHKVRKHGYFDLI